jgi:hypothetical protein
MSTTEYARVILLRHAEKYHDIKSYYLNEEGRLRSQRLSSVFVERFGRPNYILAKYPVYPTYSFRPIETIYPLALMTSSPIILFGTTKDVSDYIIRYVNTNYIIAVCWEHHEIHNIAQKLGFNDIVTWSSTPERYPIDNDDYDTMIELRLGVTKDYIVHTNRW